MFRDLLTYINVILKKHFFNEIIMRGYKHYYLTIKRCFFIIEKKTLGAILCKEIVCQFQL
jgi:hypothetical protein